jgi:hypothetical protein
LQSEVLNLGEPVDLLENCIKLEENIQPWKIVTFQAILINCSQDLAKDKCLPFSL